VPYDDDLPEQAGALYALDVPEDLALRHLARLATVRTAPVVPMRRGRRTLRTTAAGLVVGATLVSGAGVAAAGGAQPGDALYGVKTARERLQLSLSRPGESRARLELKLARTRLGEAAGLLRHGKSGRAIETLARADAALASAGAHGGADVDAEVASELDHRVEVLSGLLDGGLPATASDAAREALDRAIARGGRHRSAGAPGRDKPGKPDVRPTDPPSTKPGRGDRPHGKPSAPPGRSR
jgi:hypothetical protein